MAKIKFREEELTLGGEEVFIGSYAPEIVLTASDLSATKAGGNDGIEILVSVPSLDCDIYALRLDKFNEKMADKIAIKLNVISSDLPFAINKSSFAKNLKKLNFLSDFRDKSFGEKYGVLITGGSLAGLLTCAIFVVRDGVVIHKQILGNLNDEPNYDAVFDTIKRTGGCSCGCM